MKVFNTSFTLQSEGCTEISDITKMGRRTIRYRTDAPVLDFFSVPIPKAMEESSVWRIDHSRGGL